MYFWIKKKMGIVFDHFFNVFFFPNDCVRSIYCFYFHDNLDQTQQTLYYKPLHSSHFPEHFLLVYKHFTNGFK